MVQHWGRILVTFMNVSTSLLSLSCEGEKFDPSWEKKIKRDQRFPAGSQFFPSYCTFEKSSDHGRAWVGFLTYFIDTLGCFYAAHLRNICFFKCVKNLQLILFKWLTWLEDHVKIFQAGSGSLSFCGREVNPNTIYHRTWERKKGHLDGYLFSPALMSVIIRW